MNTVQVKQNRPGCLIQILWFLLIGWWAGQLWIIVAWILAATIIGIPLAVKMFNMLPDVMALRGTNTYTVTYDGKRTIVRDAQQLPLVIRAVWYVLIGWWLTGIWVEVAYVISLTIIGMPIGFWMFDKVPTLLSLRR